MPAKAGRKESRYIRKGGTALFLQRKIQDSVCNIYSGYVFLRLYFVCENGMIETIYKKNCRR